jgi:hypothetical protein
MAGVIVTLLGTAAAPVAAQVSDSAAAARRREGVQAFVGMSTVLLHPRCLNCHTNSDYPTRGDDRLPHLGVRRGPRNRGAAGMHCSTCHQSHNNEASGVPGAEGWELAPLSMGWERRTPRELCEQLKDPSRNGGQDRAGLLRHMSTDARVTWSWSPGAGRSPVGVPRERFVALVAAWIQHGAPCPD